MYWSKPIQINYFEGTGCFSSRENWLFLESDCVYECWTLIPPYYDRYHQGRNLPYLKIKQKIICIIFVKHFIADAWQSCEHAWGREYTNVLDMALILNIPGFWIYQGYTGFWMRLNIPGSFLNMINYVWICQNVER